MPKLGLKYIDELKINEFEILKNLYSYIKKLCRVIQSKIQNDGVIKKAKYSTIKAKERTKKSDWARTQKNHQKWRAELLSEPSS